jgi:hypothetical protein
MNYYGEASFLGFLYSLSNFEQISLDFQITLLLMINPLLLQHGLKIVINNKN